MAGWQQVSIPMTDFVRSADQPAGAPDDGLDLTDVWGYGFDLPYPAGGTYQVDQVRRTPFPPPTELVVTNLDDSGPGSLREALALIADGGTITFDPTLAGGTLTLTSGQLDIGGSVTVDASAAAPVTISAGGASRVRPGRGRDRGLDERRRDPRRCRPRRRVAASSTSATLNLDRVDVTDNPRRAAGRRRRASTSVAAASTTATAPP